ncbi:phosphonate ABC transporter, permease protein PhnE [Granulicatella sp. zg-ZJ]|uniref:phosphonate ABC transporter, permease protein PhnE n=1 Tax=unclassified Granulicatella TaxID=2630493 RepID=UPI0013C117E0|nr:MULTISPECIES: phosphonate ABC transporter, permease protein PhnE [unclassified Granulicatella]MBS4750101.1 phosphonate ABC transporter, permease protein PhnE [Carnobacteriaceae bacterium zg-ZUI78]NEW62146.1 phosphonate ABC transporter, permease protein PhnE [Granulicatella sp. zg-ZJ]NEW66600.1 phosphonate ABC transporter, permease protein PhnE [Granulicatella sp. zg-84]QMI86251.1 phosphonate ABC transporter, permease protein PhnE [Carnobacteriaceae bacterium zg-84]
MNREKIEEKLQKEPKSYMYILLITVIVLGLLIWSSSAIKKGDTTGDSLSVASNIMGGILNPDWHFLFRLDNKGVLYLLFETICIAFLGTIIGAIISIPFAFLSAKKIVSKYVAWIGKLLTMCVRTIPAFIYGLMFIGVTGPGALAGVFTMSVVSVGMVTKLYIDAIEDLDFGIIESLSAIGCTKVEQIRYGILPQLYSKLISIVIYRFDMNLRDAAVLGLVGAGGIGAPLIFAMNNYRWNEVGSILVGIIILVLIIEVFSNKIRRKLARGY